MYTFLHYELRLFEIAIEDLRSLKSLAVSLTSRLKITCVHYNEQSISFDYTMPLCLAVR